MEVCTVATSDTHGFLPDIPPCDLFLHAGDFCPTENHSIKYQYKWLRKHFCPWLNSIPAKHVVFCAGNHDFAFERPHARKIIDEYTNENVHYLQDETIKLLGLKIHGSPWTPTFFDWAFMRPDWELMPVWNKIPVDVDILMTHGPAHGVLDINEGGWHCGSESLAERLKNLSNLKLLVCGHIHAARGVRYSNNYTTTYANVAFGYQNTGQVVKLTLDL